LSFSAVSTSHSLLSFYLFIYLFKYVIYVILVYLSVNDCKFEGPLPSEMGHLWNMTRLQMQKNDLTGTIPHSFGRMDKLEQFTAEGNLLSGTVPPEVCDLTKDFLRQFVVDCYNPRKGIGFDCEPQCCTLCRDVQ
jgi:hypothetical protein